MTPLRSQQNYLKKLTSIFKPGPIVLERLIFFKNIPFALVGLSFETTLTKEIDLFGIKTSEPYSEDNIELVSVSGRTYTWRFLV